MNLDCPYLSLAKFWDDDDRNIVLVESIEAMRLCEGGAWEEVSDSATLWDFERTSHEIIWEMRGFATRIRLVSPYSTRGNDRDLIELIGDGIKFGDLVGLRRRRTTAANETEPVLVQRRLVRDIEAQSGGRLGEGGRRFKLVAGGDVAGIPDRGGFEVVGRDEAIRVLDAIAKQPSARQDLAALLAKASGMLSRDWRPPREPDGLVLLRKIVAPRVVAAQDEPAITPSQMKAMMAAQEEEPTIRLVNVESPVFAPGVEIDTISYAIDGPAAKVQSVVMVVKSAPAKGDPVVLGQIPIEGPYSASGKIEWDGKIPGETGIITLKKSPFEIAFELTSKSGNTSTSDAGKIRLEVKKIEIVVDDGNDGGDGAGDASDDADPFDAENPSTRALKGLVAELKKSGMPGNCEGRLVIDSPIFSTGSTEMSSAQSFLEYQKAVGKGPTVPVRARIELKSKSGEGKRAPAALADTRVLWDFKLEMTSDLEKSLGERGVHLEAKTFIKRAFSYQESLTRPMGVSVHFKLGGWRAKPDDRDAAGRQWQDKDDWALPTPERRTWAAITVCDGDDVATQDSGVTFFPGRMAGDVHKIRAFVDVDESLDVEDEAVPDRAPAAYRSNTIKIATWRRIPVVTSWIVGAATVPVDISTAGAEYEKAAILIEARPGLVPTDIQDTWQKHYQEAVAGYLKGSDTFLMNALESDCQGYAVRYRDFMDYWERFNASAGLSGKLWQRFKNFLGVGGEDKYRKDCEAKSIGVVQDVATKLTLRNGGLTTLKFGTSGVHNQPRPDLVTSGVALTKNGWTGRNRAIFLQFTQGQNSGTFVHEIGHTLFLAHAKGHWVPGEQPYGYQENAHDKDQICLMSYHPNKKYFCGLCLLKLAGINYKRIRNDGTIID